MRVLRFSWVTLPTGIAELWYVFGADRGGGRLAMRGQIAPPLQHYAGPTGAPDAELAAPGDTDVPTNCTLGEALAP